MRHCGVTDRWRSVPSPSNFTPHAAIRERQYGSSVTTYSFPRMMILGSCGGSPFRQRLKGI